LYGASQLGKTSILSPKTSSLNPSFAQNPSLYYNIGLQAASSSGPFRIGRKTGGYIPRFASGGHFGGDSPSDRPSAMVMGGEYIINPKTVSNYGVNYFKGLNQLANGGYYGGGTNSNSDLNNNISKLISINEEIRDKLTPTNNNQINNKTENL